MGNNFFWRERCISQKNPQNITMPLVFDDSQNAGEFKGVPTECAFIASSASYLYFINVIQVSNQRLHIIVR